ncbi:MAG: ABC transporter substrate-binding protein, partial [Chloroflexota bacterium]|nr:ABC transporter substrate-binding protein [Chloroflexota bacterium]
MSSVRITRRNINRRRLLAGMAVAGGSSLILAACGGGDGKGEQGSGSRSSGASGEFGTAAAKKEPVKGGTLKFSIGGDPPNFDVHANSTYLVNNSMAPVYNQLVRFDPAVPEEPPEAVVGDLAKSWELTGDGLRYTFKLHEGVTFHDGKPFGAVDVKASLERMMNPPKGVVSPRQDSLTVIDKIQTPDVATAVIVLKRPAPSLLPILAQGWMSIYSAQDIAGTFDFKLKTNGTGPFKLKDYVRGNRLELVANPNYFVKGQPYLDGITVFIQVDQGALVSSFQSGQTNFSSRLTESDVESMQAALGKKMVMERRNGLGFNSINFGHLAPWTDERVRRAVSLAMDRQESIDLLYEKKGSLGGYMPGGGGWALTEEELRQ